MPNKLSRFWQELKRRKVTRVITVYAASAFVILELVSMSEEPFGLPEWIFVLAVILLSIGFLIAIILSWIYDIHPEEGIVKTEPAEEAKAVDIHKSSNSWKIASYISFLVIVGLIVLNVFPRKQSREIHDKSIAVLPFRNESSDEENIYFINGIMEAILDNLCMIEDLRVPGRTSVEQYRDVAKPVPEIAEELNVGYVLQGSGQKLGNQILLTVQLLDGKNDRHIWSEQYDREIKDGKEFYALQSEIARLIADELHAIITPEEKQIINQIPTTNLKALNLFQKGREKHLTYWWEDDREALKDAIGYYRSALIEDPDFGQAYTGLAIAISNSYWLGNQINREFSEIEANLYKDSVLYLVEEALKRDPNLEEAYWVKGNYYSGIKEYDKALREYDKALSINPNYSWAYDAKSYLFFYVKNDWISGMINKLKAVELERGQQRVPLLFDLGQLYESMGFNDKAVETYEQMFLLNEDSAWYYRNMAGPAFSNRNWSEYIHWSKKMLEIAPEDSWPLSQLCWAYAIIGNMDSACHYGLMLEDIGWVQYSGDFDLHYGFTLLKTGRIDEANRVLDKLADYKQKLLESEMGNIDYLLLDLAQIYAIKGQDEAALDYLLQIDSQIFKPLWYIIILEDGPFLKNVQNRKEFQLMLKSLKSSWQAEHERVIQWLEENEML